MAAVKGSLLVTAEGMELVHVADDSRDQAVGDFHRMKTEAERHHDRFYAFCSVINSHMVISIRDCYTGLGRIFTQTQYSQVSVRRHTSCYNHLVSA